MGMLGDFANGLARGFTSAVIDNLKGQLSGLDRIEAICLEVGWSADERDGKTITLHFNHPEVGLCKVMILPSEAGQYAMFQCFSKAVIETARVPSGLPAYLLVRNAEMVVGAWSVHVGEDGNAYFVLKSGTLMEGLEGHWLKYVCETLAQEVAAFEAKLAEARLP
jgi:hypothetical protein